MAFEFYLRFFFRMDKLLFDLSDYTVSIEVVSSGKEGEVLRVEVENRISLNLWMLDIVESELKGNLFMQE